MKTTLNTFLLLAIFATQLSAQTLPNYYFGSVSEIPCPVDSTTMIEAYDDWLIYQTLDDYWDGPIDSTNCIGLIDQGGGYKIDLAQIDATKPLFIKSLMSVDNKVFLESDWLYNLQAVMEMPPGAPINLSVNCEDNVCSGVIVGIEVPNEDTTGTNLREYPVSFQDLGACDANTCLPTERFDENYLSEFIFKVSFDSLDISDLDVRPSFVDVEITYEFGFLDEPVVIGPGNYNETDSSYYMDFYDVYSSWSNSALVAYVDSTYPSPSDISYLDLNIEPNEPEAQNINFTVNVGDALIFQPFTSLRGGLVEGSDSVRHNLNFINDGGSMCMFIIELIYNDNESFTYKGGNVEFESPNSCMQFMPGSKLIVADDAYFYYGNDGMGIIALRQGSTIELGKNSTLEFNNTVNIAEAQTNVPDQFYMELNEGSTLIFGEHARLSNQYSIDKAMKLNIFMNGGVLDDSNLSKEERALINKIYPDNSGSVASASIYPNPVSTYTNWNYFAKAYTSVQLELFNMNGQLLQTEKHFLQKGPNKVLVNLRDLPAAIYFLHWQTEEEGGVLKLVK